MRMTHMALNSISSLTLAAISGCLIASFIPASAFSADMPDVPGLYSAAGPAPHFSWQGGYVGAQIGAGQMGGRVTSGTRKKFDEGGVAAGIYGGYNWEISRFVLGLEADLTHMGNEKKFNHASLGKVTAKSNWSAGLKGRVGLPIDRFMPYLSAGLTASDYELKANGVTKKSNNVSLSLGAGMEYALSDKVHLRADYSLNGLNSSSENFGGTRIKSEAAEHRLMLGLSYHF